MTLADLLRGIPPGAGLHVPAEIHEAAERKMKRAMLGGCECGYVRGEDVCPQCDLGMALPPAAKPSVDEIVKAIGKLRMRPTPRSEGRPLNRFERRRAASRRWRG